MRLELRALFVAIAVALTSLGSSLLVGLAIQPHRVASPVPAMQAIASMAATVSSRSGSEIAMRGAHLYLQNCAHCHADDATGDEGPDLHGLRKSDARIGAVIKNGIKGEMPKFGQKLTDNDVQALIGYLRTLR